MTTPLSELRSLLLKATTLAADMVKSGSCVNMEDVSERVDMAFIALDDVRGVTVEDLDQWAEEARDDRRIEEAREAA